ncbi:putative General secretion pathway protein J [Burkholderiales bacterium]|nr:putative General secretion pathway protein J [Burkholderiales bacterium]
MQRSSGFTLLELLVAVSILAVIAVIAWQGLSALTATRERLEPQNDEVHAVLAGFGQIERDLTQTPTNAVLFALPTQPLRVVAIDGHPSLQILRLAESPDGVRAASVQTVFYVVRDGALQRQSSAAQRFYSTAASELDSVALVPNIDDMRIRVWRTNVGWITPATDADTAGTIGVEVLLQRHDGTSMRRVFAVG